MKFRKLLPLIVLVVLLAGYFTKPTKEEFLKHIEPIAAASGTTPVIDYQDKFVYTTASVFLINNAGQGAQNIATGAKEEYIGAFKKFWKQSSDN